jgi:hypothetical protein
VVLRRRGGGPDGDRLVGTQPQRRRTGRYTRQPLQIEALDVMPLEVEPLEIPMIAVVISRS